MLVLLTNKCNEVCTHCMECSNPNGADYDPDLISALVTYLNALSPTAVHISGGEFTLAKDWYQVVTGLIEKLPQHVFMFGSNGWWIENDDICEQIVKLCKLDNVYSVQISTHYKYYPNYEFTKLHQKQYENLHPKIHYVENWQGEGNGSSNLKRLGRAVDLISEDEVQGYPGCAPVLTRARQAHLIGVDTYDKFIYLLTSHGYLCKPCIDMTTGQIMVGESRQCMDFDRLYNYCGLTPKSAMQVQNESFNKMKTLKFCDKCKAKKNLDPSILKRLGL